MTAEELRDLILESSDANNMSEELQDCAGALVWFAFIITERERAVHEQYRHLRAAAHFVLSNIRKNGKVKRNSLVRLSRALDMADGNEVICGEGGRR